MKTKNQITPRLCGIAVCTGAILLQASIAPAQNLFVASDTDIYQFAPDGTYSTFATEPGNAVGLAFDAAGDLFVPDSDNGKIYEIAPDGTQRAFASGLESPTALAFDSAGDLFVSDTAASAIYKFTPGGAKSTFATGLNTSYGLAFNDAGNLFVANRSDIYEITPDGTKNIFATVSGEAVGGLAFNSSGDLFAAVGGAVGYVYEFTPDGTQSIFASGLNQPLTLAFNNAGNLFVSEFGGETYIAQFTPDGTESGFDTSVGAIGLAFQDESLPVPEPSSLGLLGVGIAFLIRRSRLARRQNPLLRMDSYFCDTTLVSNRFLAD